MNLHPLIQKDESTLINTFEQPCSRLGHPCDYNPRLSFKDDTPRVLEKMSGVARSGGPVWDCMLYVTCNPLKTQAQDQ